MLTGIKTSVGKLVCCYLNGKHCIPLVLPMVRENSDVEFYFHARTFAGVDFMASPLAEFPNAHFVGDFDELKFKLNLFGAFITTDANAARAHVYSLKLVSMFEALGIPVLELQHGLFQIGLHYYDVPSGVSFWGDSLPSKSFAERVLAFYPPVRRTPSSTVIGYPPYSGKRSAAGGGEYLLVLTNLHWPTYTMDEKMSFFDAVVALVELHPELPVIWKMHHGETSPASKINQKVREVLERHPAAKERIRFAHLDAELKNRTAAEIISGAKYVVSSVSTVLLDCEMHRRPTAVYACASNDCLVKMIKSADFFCDGDSLVAMFGKGLRPIRTGKLRPYDNDAFRAALDATYKPSSITQADFLALLMSQTFRDDFIARNMAAKDAIIAALKKSDDARGATIADIKTELGNAVKENGRVAAERDAMKAELDALKGVRSKLQEALDTSGTELKGTARENGRVTAERDALKAELDVLKGARNTLQEALDSSRTELKGTIRENGQVTAERDVMRNELDALRAERTALESKLAWAIGENGKVSAERDAMKNELDALRAERAALESKLAGAVGENGKVSAERDAMKDELAALKGEKAALESKLAGTIGENGKVIAERDAMKAELDAFESERSALQEALDSSGAELQGAIRENGQLSAERDAMRGEIAVLRGERNDLQAKVAEGKAQLDAARADGQSIRASKDVAIGELKRDIAALTGVRNKLEGQCNAVTAERDRLRVQLSASQTKLADLKNERDALAGNLAAMKSLVDDRVAICDKTCADVNGQNQRLVREKAELQAKLDASQRLASALQCKLDETTRHLDKIRREVKAFRAARRSRTMRKRFNRMVKGLLPYGVTCMWKRMAYGIAEDKPLFAYRGFLKRSRRVVKFLMPYFVVALFRRMRYGKSSAR